MWVFLTDAMFSIVENRNDPTELMVRARLPGDLERHFPEAEVLELDNADYRFRVFVPRQVVEERILEQVKAIDYPDFKSQGHDRDHKLSYMQVWSAMNRAQEEARDPDRWRPN